MSPEYAMGGIFSEKSDIYSFGVLLLEIVAGKKSTSFYYRGQHFNLLSYVSARNRVSSDLLISFRLFMPSMFSNSYRHGNCGVKIEDQT